MEPTPAPENPAPSRGGVIAAFAALYLIWGSTYLAIKIATETLPPFLMSGVRFLLAGAFLYAWARARGAPRPSAGEWRATSIIGACLLLGGNGCLVWAAQRLPSGVSSLLVATTPLWMVAIDWIRPGGERPTPRVIAGLLIGFAGMALLIGPFDHAPVSAIDPLAATVVLAGGIAWAAGSIHARQARLPRSTLLATGMQMLAGGVLLALAGLVAGEPWRHDFEGVTARSVLALAYLLVVGSLIGFTAYSWLLKVSTTAKVSTYAYVNPVVAVFLGWAFGHEALALRVVCAAGVIVAAVAVIVTPAPALSRASTVTAPAPSAGPPLATAAGAAPALRSSSPPSAGT